MAMVSHQPSKSFQSKQVANKAISWYILKNKPISKTNITADQSTRTLLPCVNVCKMAITVSFLEAAHPFYQSLCLSYEL